MEGSRSRVEVGVEVGVAVGVGSRRWCNRNRGSSRTLRPRRVCKPGTLGRLEDSPSSLHVEGRRTRLADCGADDLWSSVRLVHPGDDDARLASHASALRGRAAGLDGDAVGGPGAATGARTLLRASGTRRLAGPGLGARRRERCRPASGVSTRPRRMGHHLHRLVRCRGSSPGLTTA